MANILRKIGDEFAQFKMYSLIVWLAIDASAFVLLVVGGMRMEVWMVITAMVLIAALALALIISGFYDFFSLWWDQIGKDDEYAEEDPR